MFAWLILLAGWFSRGFESHLARVPMSKNDGGTIFPPPPVPHP
jgi:hypothetical protein